MIYYFNMIDKITNDDFLGGKLKITQPAKGFRSGSDAVLLANLANTTKGKALDVGCGVGVSTFCYAFHNKQANITGIDIQENLLHLAKENAKKNEININFNKVDILKDKPEYQTYDAVITNPPFFKSGHGLISDNKIKQTANTGEIDLKKWINFCFLSLKDKGDFTIIFLADRLSELLHLMHEKFGDIEIIPLYPKAGKNAGRIIIKAKKNTAGITKLTSGIILHDEAGKSTIENILRNGEKHDI